MTKKSIMMMVVTSHIVENPECLPYVLLLVLVMNLSHDLWSLSKGKSNVL